LTIGGPVATVAKDVSRVLDVGKELGLTLDVSKCELIAENACTVNDSLLQSFPMVPIRAPRPTWANPSPTGVPGAYVG